MVEYKLILLLLTFIVLEKDSNGLRVSSHNRQKRCIVVQKQSGTHGDSTEGGGVGDDDDDFKTTKKNPPPASKRWNARADDVEDFSSLPVKYKILPKKWLYPFRSIDQSRKYLKYIAS